jgi:ATP phosphoribosyltransferase
MTSPNLILAVPKGRILEELAPVLAACGITPEPAFYDEKSRLLKFKTNIETLHIIRVRSFDVATFTAFGAAHLGIAGSDVTEEFDYPELYAPVDLKIGQCRLSVAMPEAELAREKPRQWSHVRVATKYPNLTRKHFAARGIQSECIKLSGAMEIAPALGLARRIVDLVSSGGTLKANGLVEVERIMDVSSRLIVNRTALKTMPDVMNGWIETFRKAV